jgi:hypothetical protein
LIIEEMTWRRFVIAVRRQVVTMSVVVESDAPNVLTPQRADALSWFSTTKTEQTNKAVE